MPVHTRTELVLSANGGCVGEKIVLYLQGFAINLSYTLQQIGRHLLVAIYSQAYVLQNV